MRTHDSGLQTKSRRSPQGGFIVILFGIGVAAVAVVAGIASVIINHADNVHTVNVLTNPEARAADLEAITDQQLTNARNELPNSAGLVTGFVALGTAPLGDGKTSAEVAGSAIAQVAAGNVEPAVIDYMSNPDSTWNKNGGANKPSEGILPTGGVVPSDPGVVVGAPDMSMAKCPTYTNTVGPCAGENGCAGPGACACAAGSQYCCPPGFCYTRDIAGCQQETCPSGVGRHFNDSCACDAPMHAVYDPCRSGFLVRCDP